MVIEQALQDAETGLSPALQQLIEKAVGKKCERLFV